MTKEKLLRLKELYEEGRRCIDTEWNYFWLDEENRADGEEGLSIINELLAQEGE